MSDTETTTSAASGGDDTAILADVAALFDAEGGEAPPAKEPPAPEASGEQETPATQAKDDKAKDKDKDEPQSEGKAWKAIRRRGKELDQREAALSQKETLLKANEAALAEKARKAETYEKRVAELETLIARIQDGDPEAFASANIDVEKINASYLKHQSGDARIERLEREAAERRKRDEDTEAARKKADEERAAAERDRQEVQGIIDEITTLAKSKPLLSKRDAVAICDVVASRMAKRPEWQGKRIPFAAIVDEAEASLRREAEEMARELGFTPAPAAKADPKTITRADAAERGRPRPAPVDRDEELADIASMF